MIDPVYLNMLEVHLNQAKETTVVPIHIEVKLHWLQIIGEKNSVNFDKQPQTYVSSIYMFSNIVSAYTDI